MEASDESAGLSHGASPVSSTGSQSRLAVKCSAVLERCNSLSPVSTLERGVLFLEKRLLSKGRCAHGLLQASH